MVVKNQYVLTIYSINSLQDPLAISFHNERKTVVEKDGKQFHQFH